MWRGGAVFLVCQLMFSAPTWSQENLQKIKADYQAGRAQLKKHLVREQWIDDDPHSPEILARQWTLAGQWAAAWLDARGLRSLDDLKSMFFELESDKVDYVALNDTTFLLTAPGPIGNVFIVTKRGGHFYLAWSIAQPQQGSGRQAGVLAAWRAENARHGRRGPYWAASGPVHPGLGKLPSDVHGHPRFYIDGIYAQSAGGTVGAQTTLWLWDGSTARPLLAREYTLMIDSSAGTRLEGDLLKVQQKKFFRSFFSCGACEERQTDWIVRITPEGLKVLGEKVVTPELDAVDELFYRIIHGRPVSELGSPAALATAERIVHDARAEQSAKQWKQFPSLGMMNWTLSKGRVEETLCLTTDDTGANVFRMKAAGDRFFIIEIREAKPDCGR